MEEDQRRQLAPGSRCVLHQTTKEEKKNTGGILAEKTTCHVWNRKSLEHPLAEVSFDVGQAVTQLGASDITQ